MGSATLGLQKHASRVLARNRRATQPNKPLLPPLPLYRRILRVHQNLPAPQRELGDQYVKNEFKLHKGTTNPLHIVGFLASWQDYLHVITQGQWHEATLSAELLDKMSPEQVTQLYELMKETETLRLPEDN
ncbi:LANO_0G01266g1_1 [Lachancea nothofagi CBS 11611]|uniref:Succinate dehydrogenase assembly factor 3 n=1 Tax=Lachancea nothofagi CBS 11611 TaxID=1266666 RepID=A0A1G4KEP8_9SACH|nr:LANO_0G01266g1_1 [Lachancea nothofagi CBS 11611]